MEKIKCIIAINQKSIKIKDDANINIIVSNNNDIKVDGATFYREILLLQNFYNKDDVYSLTKSYINRKKLSGKFTLEIYGECPLNIVEGISKAIGYRPQIEYPIENIFYVRTLYSECNKILISELQKKNTAFIIDCDYDNVEVIVTNDNWYKCKKVLNDKRFQACDWAIKLKRVNGCRFIYNIKLKEAGFFRNCQSSEISKYMDESGEDFEIFGLFGWSRNNQKH